MPVSKLPATRRMIIGMPSFIDLGYFIKTVDKRALVDYLRDERDKARSPERANAMTDVIREVESGNLDG